MKMRDALMEVYNILKSDETLMRLLYYTTNDMYDISDTNDSNHPLNPTRDDILSKPVAEKWDIIYDLIKTTNTIDGIDTDKKNRVCIYAGRRSPDNKRSYRISEQVIIVDVYSPSTFDAVDFRLSWICDRINELLFDDDFDSGIGNLGFEDGGKIQAPNFSYNGYKLLYRFSDFN